MIVVITTWAMPSFLNYYRSARVRAGAQAISAYLNEARQLAIKTNAAVCFFRTSSTAVQYRNNTCTTAIAVTIDP
jgi:Tfp pilus assembly protein FimT